MSKRFAWCSFLASFFLLLLANDIRSQYCIGSTGYRIRDEKGAVMSVDEIEKLTMTVNGYQLEWYHDGAYRAFRIETKRGSELTKQRGGHVDNPINFGINLPAFCGRLGEIVIKKDDVEMHLIFNVEKHNTYYFIDSLPFQAGKFRLKSHNCEGGKPAPLIDNNRTGACFVSADMWERAEMDKLKRSDVEQLK